MQTLRLTMFAHAPVDRCYRLALTAELARDAMDGWRAEREAEEQHTLAPGEALRWGAQRRIRVMGTFTETITAVRERTLIRRTLTGPQFAWGEGEQHFAAIDNGTRIREEVRFAARPGLLCSLRERRMRRAITRMMESRAAFLRSVAEGAGWAHYLHCA